MNSPEKEAGNAAAIKHASQVDDTGATVQVYYPEDSVPTQKADVDIPPDCTRTGAEGDGVSRRQAKAARKAFAAAMLSMFMEGWNDGTKGPILPAVQHHYEVFRVSL